MSNRRIGNGKRKQYATMLATAGRSLGGREGQQFLAALGLTNGASPRNTPAYLEIDRIVPGFLGPDGHINWQNYPTVPSIVPGEHGRRISPSLADLVRHARGEITLPLSSAIGSFAETASCALGSMVDKHIESSMGPFHTFPNYRIRYPQSVIQALGELYIEYNRTFHSPVALNREWPEDYQYCQDSGGSPLNFAVQIDMLGLSDSYLTSVASLTSEEVRESLRGKIFEIENSLAMYQLLERLFASENRESFFGTRFRAVLDAIRHKCQKPIALLAVTDQKYREMLASEFGKHNDGTITNAEVKDLSGFDRFFGPAEFSRYLESNHGNCDYLLYVRSSDPVEKLKDPNSAVVHPLLGDPALRRIIKTHSLTLNVDAPQMDYRRRINDTKAYLSTMHMGHEVGDVRELTDRVGIRSLSAYLTARGVDLRQTSLEDVVLRAKPLKGTYGCYGHLSGTLRSLEFQRKFALALRQRGRYVIQPELTTPRIVNTTDGRAYTYIDRVFFAIVNEAPQFLVGERTLMPVESDEAKHGRIHGNKDTVTAEITD